nr:hypothetical protein Iba_chr01aCG20870 [Ipomoea batatas]GMD27529.1 hypothetical protein Iba_scaffold43028CG0030 [Ipomoea batatas]
MSSPLSTSTPQPSRLSRTTVHHHRPTPSFPLRRVQIGSVKIRGLLRRSQRHLSVDPVTVVTKNLFVQRNTNHQCDLPNPPEIASGVVYVIHPESKEQHSR